MGKLGGKELDAGKLPVLTGTVIFGDCIISESLWSRAYSSVDVMSK